MMGLGVLHPGILIAGLACIAIPVLVHLLRRKHRPISWGAMRFLEQAYKKRRRLITIEQLLLLLTRCAIIALLAGGVGSLMLGSGLKETRARTRIIILDNSIHSQTDLGSGQTALKHAQQRSVQLLSTLDATRGDRAALITLAAPATGIAIPPTSELGLIRSKIQSITATDAERDVNGALYLTKLLLGSNDSGSIPEPALFLSPGGWDRESGYETTQGHGVGSIMIDAPGSTHPNIAITNATPLRPMVTRIGGLHDDTHTTDNEIQGIRITLERTDPGSPATTPITIEDAGTGTTLKAETINWSPGQQTITTSIPIEPARLEIARGGSSILRVSIAHTSPPDPTNTNPGDDTRLVGLPVRQHIGVGIIDDFGHTDGSSIRPSRWVRAVLGADDGLVSIQQINASSAGDRIDPTLDVLFLLAPGSLDERGWSRIARLNEDGMPVIITPDSDPDALAWFLKLDEIAPGMLANPPRLQSFDPTLGLASTLGNENTSTYPLLSGIENEYPDLASSVTITQRLALNPGDASDVVMRGDDGEPIILVSSTHNQRTGDMPTNAPVVLMGLALDAAWTDLPARPFFVAMMHEMLRSILASSIAPDNRVAGLDATGLGFTQLESLFEAGVLPGPSQRGAFVLVDAQGISQRPVIINPDVSRTSVPVTDQESAVDAITRRMDGTEIIDLASVNNLTNAIPGESSSPGRSIALVLFAIAVGLGLIELLLARRCSYRALGNPGATLQGGAA